MEVTDWNSTSRSPMAPLARLVAPPDLLACAIACPFATGSRKFPIITVINRYLPNDKRHVRLLLRQWMLVTAVIPPGLRSGGAARLGGGGAGGGRGAGGGV